MNVKNLIVELVNFLAGITGVAAEVRTTPWTNWTKPKAVRLRQTTYVGFRRISFKLVTRWRSQQTGPDDQLLAFLVHRLSNIMTPRRPIAVSVSCRTNPGLGDIARSFMRYAVTMVEERETPAK